MTAYTRQAHRAQGLRNAMTEPEVMLWSRLKRLRAEGFHIRRQVPFRGYYLDFACLARRVIIEVDGGHHGTDGQAAHDAVRDAVLQREGFRVLRFWSHEVRQNLDGVMSSIRAALEGIEEAEGLPTRLAPVARATLPIKGREKGEDLA